MEKELQVVMRDAASLRRDITRMGLTNCQKKALESSAVFQETELGSFVEESEAAGLDTSLLAQVHNKPTGETWGGVCGPSPKHTKKRTLPLVRLPPN